MDDDVFRIVISTDNHLGFMEKDPVRCHDALATFNEVMVVAKDKRADFVLLAGDMFHENKPSRRTMHSTLSILSEHVFGTDPVFMQLLINPAEVLKKRQVNFLNASLCVCLPIFSIHGNHDDPSREGVGEPLSAMDILSEANMVNYFGTAVEVDRVEVTPVLMRKGGTHIALYGLGAIRDERLNRMWNMKKVLVSSGPRPSLPFHASSLPQHVPSPVCIVHAGDLCAPAGGGRARPILQHLRHAPGTRDPPNATATPIANLPPCSPPPVLPNYRHHRQRRTATTAGAARTACTSR